MTTPSQVPVRYPSGVTTDYQWGPLANSGAGNPFFYQTISDDFMGLVAGNENWATVTSGTGAAVAEVAGDGGQWLLTTSTAGAGTAGIKGNANNFFLPPATFSGAGLTATLYPSKKVFFLCRINVTTVASTTVYAGLVPSTTTTALPTDGIFFALTSASAGVLQAYSASAQLWSVAIPLTTLAGGAYANAQWLDLGFYMDRSQNVYAFAGFPLVGWLPPSAWTGINNVNAAPPALGAVAAYQTGVSGAWTPTVVGLTPAVIASATIQTVYMDFLMASKER
jgi:hypothetical protein